MKISRRHFIKTAAYSTGASLTPLSLTLPTSAMANSESDYKALVCLFFYGGNDSFNMVLPADGNNLINYQNSRPDIQLYPHELVNNRSIEDDVGQTLSLNGAMPNISELILSGAATTLLNVGTLIEPTTKQNYNSVKKPPNLGAHNKQQLAWQRSWNTSEYHPYGWAGMMMDFLATGTEGVSPAFSLGTNNWLNGQSTESLALSSQGVRAMNALTDFTINRNLTRLLSSNSASIYGKTYLDRFQQVYDYQNTLTSVLEQYPADESIPSGFLGGQFKMVKRMVQASTALGQARQVYFVAFGGFDNHRDQRGKHEALLGQVDSALSAFYSSLKSVGLEDKVITFTMSDFGRTIENNSNRGTDHGWGSNQLIIGGPIKGRKAHGTFPEFIRDGKDAVGNKFIPTVASEQYAATLCKWFGLSDTAVDYIFPTLSPDNENPFNSRYLNFIKGLNKDKNQMKGKGKM
ncbi:DUF1501 domain-containing protein [Vibrio astriarenae]|uniref:DUF1501 domain-containing protein n=1 Tax=Vibrio astriarenae TaxID=1481923 RepID=A0A7Z2T445_9VIBR|nr:DUF1501 domain-containing protein [Vibrio astriarenae]QIA64029.1 DUF1501 domain-containing protein [Vibrio astriarenae]